MEVGTDSYVTIAEADAYIVANYPDLQTWSEKSEDQKQALLMGACLDLESLPFPGQASQAGQVLSFPRFGSEGVPLAIKAAQIEIALLPLTQSTEAEKRNELQRQGVKSFSIGDLSESYGEVSGLMASYAFMQNEKVARLLMRYLGGAYEIC